MNISQIKLGVLVSAVDGLIGTVSAVQMQSAPHIIVSTQQMHASVVFVPFDYIDRMVDNHLYLNINKQTVEWLTEAPIENEDYDHDTFVYF